MSASQALPVQELGIVESTLGITIDGEVTQINVDGIINRLLEAKKKPHPEEVPIMELEIVAVCRKVKELFISAPILLDLMPHIYVVGDIHGQLPDLIKWFDILGYPNERKFLFLGNYINRGKFSIETLMLLFCYKIKYPSHVFLIRGNHETSVLCRIHGFMDDCKRRYHKAIYAQFLDLFNYMPLAAIIADKIFCVHAGLSPELHSIDQIKKLPRPVHVHQEQGIVCDILWADLNRDDSFWGTSDRGMACTFGQETVEKFLKKHDMDLLVRGHELIEDGMEFYGKKQVVTLFSAPNYCMEYENSGAIMSVNDALICSFKILKPRFVAPRPKRGVNSGIFGSSSTTTPSSVT